jgi:hypothetical protein
MLKRNFIEMEYGQGFAPMLFIVKECNEKVNAWSGKKLFLFPEDGITIFALKHIQF